MTSPLTTARVAPWLRAAPLAALAAHAGGGGGAARTAALTADGGADRGRGAARFIGFVLGCIEPKFCN